MGWTHLLEDEGWVSLRAQHGWGKGQMDLVQHLPPGAGSG